MVFGMTQPLILVTGFGPFGEVVENPSGLLAGALESEPELLDGPIVVSRVLPVTFADAPSALHDFVSSNEARLPRALLSMGVHPGRGFRLERLARAHPSSKTTDTSGVVGSDENPTQIELIPREASFDVQALLADLGYEDARTSDDAGGYVCDWVYQHLLAHGRRLGIPALFLHVPSQDVTPLAQQLPFVRKVVQSLASL